MLFNGKIMVFSRVVPDSIFQPDLDQAGYPEIRAGFRRAENFKNLQSINTIHCIKTFNSYSIQISLYEPKQNKKSKF